MMLARKLTKMYSIEEYLNLEDHSHLKHEFHNGELYAMAGGTVDHSTLTGNMLTELKIALHSKQPSCKVHTSDMKIYIQDKQNKGSFVSVGTPGNKKVLPGGGGGQVSHTYLLTPPRLGLY